MPDTPDRRFNVDERDATRGDFRPGTDGTLLAVPLTIFGTSAADGVRIGTELCTAISDLVAEQPHVRWAESKAEAAFVMASSLLTALGGLPLRDRLRVLASMPDDDRARLRSLLQGPQG